MDSVVIEKMSFEKLKMERNLSEKGPKIIVFTFLRKGGMVEQQCKDNGL